MQFFQRMIWALLLAFFYSAQTFAQLPSFSGFWLTPQLTAPTAMAVNDAYQVTTHYRRQGFEENTGYRTYLLSGQLPLYNQSHTHFGTMGVNVVRNESGSSHLLATSGVILSYLYDAAIAQQHHLVGGVQGAYYGRNIDWSKARTRNQFVNGNYDPAISLGEQFSDDPSKAFLVNVGLAYYLTDYGGDQLFHIGGAITNANSSSFQYLNNSESQSVPRAFVAYSQIKLISSLYFDVVSDLYWRNENKVNDLIGGFKVRKGTNSVGSVADNHLGVGLYYSQDHTGILALQLIQPNWLIGISYDMAFGNRLLGSMQNGVEVSLGWRSIREGKRINNHSRRKPSWMKSKRKLPWMKNKRKLPWNRRKKLPWQSRW